MTELITVYTENQTIKLLRHKRSHSDNSPTRAPKRNESCPAQLFMNAKHSYQRLENMLAANVRPGDLIGVLTYNDEYLPGSRRDVQSDLSYFFRKLRRAYADAGAEPTRIVWSIEHSHEDGVHKGSRWHIHFAMRAAGEDFQRIRACWFKGIVLITFFTIDPAVWMKQLKVRGIIRSEASCGYEPLARYMCKEGQERLGQRTWSYSRACFKPEYDRIEVEADTKLVAPDGCQTVVHRVDSNSFEMLKYINRTD